MATPIQGGTAKSRCTACKHPDVLEIDRSLVMGVPVNSLARKYGISRDTVMRHHKNHVKEDEVDAKLAVPDSAGPIKLDTPQDIIDAFKMNYAKNASLAAQAEKSGDMQLYYKCLNNEAAILDRFAKSYNLFSDQAIINIDTSTKKIEMIVNDMSEEQLRAYLTRNDKGYDSLVKAAEVEIKELPPPPPEPEPPPAPVEPAPEPVSEYGDETYSEWKDVE